jgi:hypothetical protein
LYWGNPKQQGTKSWQASNINGPCAIYFWIKKKKLPFRLKDSQQFQMNLLHCSCKPLDRRLIKQANPRTPKFHPLLKLVAPLHHCTVKENANKFHHLLYLWQQEKNKPKPSIIVFMTTHYTCDITKR